MRILYSILFALSLLSLNTHAMGSKKPSSDWFAAERIKAIQDMAPRIGIPVEKALKGKAAFKRCDATGTNGDGPYIDGKKNDCAEITGSVHAWCIPDFGGYTRYMFAVIKTSKSPSLDVKVWCVRHEVMHELLDAYGLTGHPLKVTVKRMDNGKSITFKPGEIINGRWPSAVNVFLPDGMEVGTDWPGLCGHDEIMRGDGEGI